ncbi:MAG: carboxylesterase family protein [Maricaulaceae bacterium]|jgi:para-nitrobenzyl esterase
MNRHHLSRRTILLAAGAAACTPHALSGSNSVVETTEGRYQGLQLDGVHVFKGMRYGASTAGRGRFMPPQSAPRFAGVREAFEYGDQTPQARGSLAADTAMSEDCLRINVWTPELRRGRRPVLLWFHGGGFEAGSGSSALYDGAHMALRGDVVVCTINHRLNVFGFCDLSEHLGEDFAQSGNVGYLDLVASMRWVRENIAEFGGDPNNVMIYGQSGGGRKVSVCFAGKPSAGLFAKGVVQSGSHLRVQTPEQSHALTNSLLAELGIDPANARALQDVPQETLSEVQRRVIGAAGYRFEPNLDGINFEAHPFIPNAPRQTAQVPMMLGTTRTELSNQLGHDPEIYTIDEAGLKERLARFFPPEEVDEAVDVFQQSNPNASPTEIFFLLTSWRSYILNATLMAESRAELNGANNPTWMYQVTWRSPAEGGRRYSQHTLDLPFMFDNVDRAERLTGPETDETRAMADAMANAWISFARNGDPNHDGIPQWPTYDLASRSVMHFEVPATVVEDPFRSEREYMNRYDSVRATARRDG